MTTEAPLGADLNPTIAIAESSSAEARPWQGVRSLFAVRRAKIGLVFTLLIVLFALLGPLFAPHAPDQIVGAPYEAASKEAVLGTDYLGEDILSRILWGGRSVVWMSIAATLIGVVVGSAVGMIGAYTRNWLDDLIVWGMDIGLAFPQIVFVLLFIALLGRSEQLIVVLVGIGWIPVAGRMARSVTLEVVNAEFVEAAEMMGLPRRKILGREILPNILTPILVQTGGILTWTIGIIAGLSFLGDGIQPPNADWGLMINENFDGITIQPWSVIGPILCIALYALATNTLAEGVSRSVAGVESRN